MNFHQTAVFSGMEYDNVLPNQICLALAAACTGGMLFDALWPRPIARLLMRFYAMNYERDGL